MGEEERKIVLMVSSAAETPLWSYTSGKKITWLGMLDLYCLFIGGDWDELEDKTWQVQSWVMLFLKVAVEVCFNQQISTDYALLIN